MTNHVVNLTISPVTRHVRSGRALEAPSCTVTLVASS